ncbi:MAG TPA: LUD domain-containing protein [Anaerolineales bacterium]|nr:LUD domain-containing protein [Anaerolineales bacterium]
MSSVPFRRQIREALANQPLQAALDANAHRRVSGRAAAFASLPDLTARRRRAHAVRAETMRRLPELLKAFTEKAGENGFEVHRAADAGEARRLVLLIAEKARRRFGLDSARPLLFAKSKSMVSEEIELNAALEREGHRVVETDLGEYIVQLRGEKPAHIITPAVHLQRHQVGELFRDKLGISYTEDIPALTAAARRVLRQVFFSADVGISGVNFGVAETGGLCIVTNEGNGRMVASVPRVHVALMGMERLVPTLEDLSLMLSLLPRSATGQKLTVYTQLIHAPRPAGEEDGATERHIIIVDNGRSRLWASSLQEALYCIRCGACLNACPVFREIGGHAYVGAHGAQAPYPGPIGSVVTPGLEGLAEFGHLAQASSLCGACKDACPVDIDLPKLLIRIRSGAPATEPGGEGIGLGIFTRWALRAYTEIAASSGRFAWAQRAAAGASRALWPGSNWIALPGFTGWGLRKDMPRPAARSFRERWKDGMKAAKAAEGSARQAPPAEAGKREIPDGASRGPEDRVALAERFATELEALGAQVHHVPREDLSGRLLEALRSRSIDRVLRWEEIEGVDTSQFMQAGIRTAAGADADAGAGITGCLCAIADTGTLLVASGPGRSPSASLFPEVHIAVVHLPQIVASLEEAMKMPPVREAAVSVLITGPSRTADIEMTLTIGVHGPKELLVYIVE